MSNLEYTNLIDKDVQCLSDEVSIDYLRRYIEHNYNVTVYFYNTISEVFAHAFETSNIVAIDKILDAYNIPDEHLTRKERISYYQLLKK